MDKSHRRIVFPTTITFLRIVSGYLCFSLLWFGITFLLSSLVFEDINARRWFHHAMALLFVCITGWALYVLLKRLSEPDCTCETTGSLETQSSPSENTAAQEQLHLIEKVFEHAAEGIMITDADAQIMTVNTAFMDITGYQEAEVIGKNPRFLASGQHNHIFYQQMWTQVSTDGLWKGEIWNKRKNGDIYPQWLSLSRVQDAEGLITHYIGIFTDMTEHKANQAHIQKLAHYDSLTELPNRSLLADRVKQVLYHSDRKNEIFSLVFLDLDHFKNINDTLGHHIGDQLLIQVAERLRQTLRNEDTIARLGGDEFVLLLPDTGTKGATRVAEKILSVLSKPYRLSNHELVITSSLGIALYPTDATTYENLAMCADSAMYKAKQSGRHTFCFFTKQMQEESRHTMIIESALRMALELNQMQLYFQPFLSLSDNKITSAEVLPRWQHPELGLIKPADFIHVAEDRRLVHIIDEWMLRNTLKQLHQWAIASLPEIAVSANISAALFWQQNFPDQLARMLDETALKPEKLMLEITERVAMDCSETIIDTMERLHAFGIRISIDDFGLGRSSLPLLKRYMIHALKINATLVSDIGLNEESQSVIEAIIGLAQQLGFKTIAENVETETQFVWLKDKGCDIVQGYFIAPPMPAEKFADFLRSHYSAR